MKTAENILENRLLAEELAYNSIYNDYTYINRQRYHFKPTSLVGDLCIYLPEEFMDMPKIYAKTKYPSENRPPIIKSSNDTAINFCFNYFPPKVEEHEVPKITTFFLSTQRKLFPHNHIEGINIEYVEDNKSRTISWFSYTSNAADDDVYNLQTFQRIGERILYGFFCCSLSVRDKWHKVALETFASAQIEENI